MKKMRIKLAICERNDVFWGVIVKSEDGDLVSDHLDREDYDHTPTRQTVFEFGSPEYAHAMAYAMECLKHRPNGWIETSHA